MIKLLNSFNLYEFLTIKIINQFEKHLELTDLQKDKLYYGVISILLNIIKTAFICLIAYFLGVLSEMLIMTLIVGSLRLTAAGLHAKSNFMCTLTTLVVYIGGAILSRHYPISFHMAFFIIMVSILIMFKYAPADTENRPIIGEEKRKKLKIQTLIIATLLLIINLIINSSWLINLTMVSMVFQTIAIIPVTYKILKRSCNNYEKFEKQNL